MVGSVENHNKRKKIYIHVQACDRRGLDANKTAKYLSKNNYEIVNRAKNADIILFFACAALNTITEDSLKTIKKFQKYDAELIIAGCLPEIEKEKLSKIFNGKTICTKDIEKIDTIFPENRIKYSTTDDANIVFKNLNELSPLEILKRTFRSIKSIESIYINVKNHIFKNLFGENSFIYRVFPDPLLYHVRTSTGCSGNCSYCSIKKGIGPCASKPLEDCIEEFRNGLNKGYKRFAIDGDDTGAYGIDIGSNLPELLYKITEIQGDYKISIRNIRPDWIVRYINDLEIILKRKKIISIESSIQSGSIRILKLMNRYSDIEKMKNAFLRLKKSFPSISLVTDYIIGFPTESEEDFKQTLDYLKEINFNAGMIIPFSCNTGTEAEKIVPKITRKDTYRRIKNAKKFLKKSGYHILFIPWNELFIFWNENYKNS